MLPGCSEEPECTVAQTGKCLRNNDPDTCPNRQSFDVSASLADLPSATAPPLSKPKSNPQFPGSLTLSPAQARKLMGQRYCHVIGIIGAPDAGKTAAIVSLYLLLSHGQLRGWTFGDSLSLRALDEVSQGARRWTQGGPPEQMTTHTELPDERTPGFMHLRLHSDEGVPVDLLLPDLPGEWSTALIDSNRTDRLAFMEAADVIWLMLDGRALIEPQGRQLALHRASVAMQRLSDFLSRLPPLIAVISRRDLGEIPQKAIDDLQEEAKRLGFDLRIATIASFADNGSVPPGTGIAELVHATTHGPEQPLTFWPEQVGPGSNRMIDRLRREA